MLLFPVTDGAGGEHSFVATGGRQLVEAGLRSDRGSGVSVLQLTGERAMTLAVMSKEGLLAGL